MSPQNLTLDPSHALENSHAPDPRVPQIAAHVKEIIRILGLCPDKDPNLVDTDLRVAKM